MNKEIIRIIMMLSVVIALSACTGIETQHAVEAKDRPILSAEQAQAMIRVTVISLAPPETETFMVQH
jgi:hypothetical protein